MVYCKDGGVSPTNTGARYLWSRTRTYENIAQHYRDWLQVEEKRGIGRLSQYHLDTRFFLEQRMFSGWEAVSTMHGVPITHLPKNDHRLGKGVRLNRTFSDKEEALNPLLIGISMEEILRRVTAQFGNHIITGGGNRIRSMHGQGCGFPLLTLTKTVRSMMLPFL